MRQEEYGGTCAPTPLHRPVTPLLRGPVPCPSSRLQGSRPPLSESTCPHANITLPNLTPRALFHRAIASAGVARLERGRGEWRKRAKKRAKIASFQNLRSKWGLGHCRKIRRSESGVGLRAARTWQRGRGAHWFGGLDLAGATPRGWCGQPSEHGPRKSWRWRHGL